MRIRITNKPTPHLKHVINRRSMKKCVNPPSCFSLPLFPLPPDPSRLACRRPCILFLPCSFYSRSLVLSLAVESIYVHECGFQLRPLLLLCDYRRKEGQPDQYFTQTFRPRRHRGELLVPAKVVLIVQAEFGDANRLNP